MAILITQRNMASAFNVYWYCMVLGPTVIVIAKTNVSSTLNVLSVIVVQRPMGIVITQRNTAGAFNIYWYCMVLRPTGIVIAKTNVSSTFNVLSVIMVLGPTGIIIAKTKMSPCNLLNCNCDTNTNKNINCKGQMHILLLMFTGTMWY